MLKRNETGCEQLDNDVELKTEFRNIAIQWFALWVVFIATLIIGVALIPVVVGK